MKLKPVNDKIVVKPNKPVEEQVTEGGILLPETVNQGALNEGTVVAVSKGMYSAQGTLIPMVIKEDDVILYNKNYMGSEHKVDGETYIIMSQNDVLSVVEG